MSAIFSFQLLPYLHELNNGSHRIQLYTYNPMKNNYKLEWLDTEFQQLNHTHKILNFAKKRTWKCFRVCFKKTFPVFSFRIFSKTSKPKKLSLYMYSKFRKHLLLVFYNSLKYTNELENTVFQFSLFYICKSVTSTCFQFFFFYFHRKVF